MRCCSLLFFIIFSLGVLFLLPNQTLLVIHQSGNIVIPAFTLTINKDGSGQMQDTHGNDIQDFAAHTFSLDTTEKDMQQIPNPQKIPTGHCLKSTSFGTTTTVSYNAQTSGDLQCLAKNTTPLQKDFVKQIAALEKQAIAIVKPTANV